MTRTFIAVAAMSLPSALLGDAAIPVARANAGASDGPAEVACAQEAGQALGLCVATVARDGGTGSTVTVTFPNGFARRLMFEDGSFVRGNATMSGVGTDNDWRLGDGIYHIRVDDQRFEIPETLVLGD